MQMDGAASISKNDFEETPVASNSEGSALFTIAVTRSSAVFLKYALCETTIYTIMPFS